MNLSSKQSVKNKFYTVESPLVFVVIIPSTLFSTNGRYQTKVFAHSTRQRSLGPRHGREGPGAISDGCVRSDTFRNFPLPSKLRLLNAPDDSGLKIPKTNEACGNCTIKFPDQSQMWDFLLSPHLLQSSLPKITNLREGDHHDCELRTAAALPGQHCWVGIAETAGRDFVTAVIYPGRWGILFVANYTDYKMTIGVGLVVCLSAIDLRS